MEVISTRLVIPIIGYGANIVSDDGTYNKLWYIPAGSGQQKNAMTTACSDNGSNVGDELQTFVTTTNAAWKALPSGSNDKYTGAQRDKIRDWVNEMIALRTKYNLPSVTLENYLNGQNFSPLPATASAEDRTRDGQLIRNAASLRASAQGIYIHARVEIYSQSHSYAYSNVGVDVTVAADTGKGYVERRYEILRDTEGCWQRHYRETMNTVSWRAIVYI